MIYNLLFSILLLLIFNIKDLWLFQFVLFLWFQVCYNGIGDELHGATTVDFKNLIVFFPCLHYNFWRSCSIRKLYFTVTLIFRLGTLNHCCLLIILPYEAQWPLLCNCCSTGEFDWNGIFSILKLLNELCVVLISKYSIHRR